MKTAILMKSVAALTICAAFPLGAIAEPAMLRERYAPPLEGTIKRVETSRKHYFARNWLES